MTWVAFDTETTGLEPGSRPVELAAVAFDDAGVVLDTFSELMQPDMLVPPGATAVHGITDAMLAYSPDTRSVLTRFLAWLPRDGTLIGHNSGYDQNVVTWSCQRVGLQPPTAAVIDTLPMARLDRSTRHGLEALVATYGFIVDGPAHRAMPDADAVRHLFLLLRQQAVPNPRPWSSSWTYSDTLPESMQCLPELVATGQPLSFAYGSPSGRSSRHTIIPYGWARLSGDRTVMHGLCQRTAETRSFRVDRVERILSRAR